VLFAQIGQVESVTIITDRDTEDRDTGRPRGFAFVEFSAQTDADADRSAPCTSVRPAPCASVPKTPMPMRRYAVNTV
jgi:hypothetical protein